MHFTYYPKGVCSKQYEFEIENNVIQSVQIFGGCQGNLAGISKLITGMNIDDVIAKLEGTTCGFKPTSCPDQIAQALKEFKAQ